WENVFAPMGITAAYQPGLLPEDALLCDMYQMPEKRLSKSLQEERAAGAQYADPDPESHYYLTAGKLVISAPDLCKLLIALCDDGFYDDVQLLGSEMVREMRTRQNDRYSVRCESGRGLFMNIYKDIQVEGRTLYGHGGKAHGMLCAAYFDPGDRTGVVMLTNGCNNQPMRNGVGLLGREVLTAVYELWLNREHVEVDAFSVQ
ncbi:MAG: serine hydrolase, partial [Clostridia bacterium]|nr:serine hydrolase [Clostridia bacterium]